tara:strand:+ start:667 stop:975 length:309 start_codon:yes stop_codon:yes gene_type:complete
MLANIKFEAIEELKMLKAETTSGTDILLKKWLKLAEEKRMKEKKTYIIKQFDDEMYYEEKFNNSVYDEEGKFIPYSTIISTIEQHEALMKFLSEKRNPPKKT